MSDEPKPPLNSSAALARPTPSQLVPDGRGLTEAVGSVRAWAGPKAADQTLIFLTATIENPHTRRAYRRAVARFVDWCAARDIPIERVSPPLVAAHMAELGRTLTPPSVKLHLSALNHWCDKLVLGHVLAVNPVHAVRGPRYSQEKGKTPVFEAADAKRLLTSIDRATLAGARDSALLAVMLFSFARIGAVLKMRVRDYRGAGTSNPCLMLHEKGGRSRSIKAHHQACEHLDAYVALAGLAGRPELFLWQGFRGGRLSGQMLTQSAACSMVKRRCRAAGLPDEFCNHSLRATGITIYRERGGDLEAARQLAGHASVRTTQAYDRSGDRQSRAEIERVQL